MLVRDELAKVHRNFCSIPSVGVFISRRKMKEEKESQLLELLEQRWTLIEIYEKDCLLLARGYEKIIYSIKSDKVVGKIGIDFIMQYGRNKT